MKAFDFKPSDSLIIKAQLLPLIFKIATIEDAGRFSQENFVFILCSIVEAKTFVEFRFRRQPVGG